MGGKKEKLAADSSFERHDERMRRDFALSCLVVSFVRRPPCKGIIFSRILKLPFGQTHCPFVHWSDCDAGVTIGYLTAREVSGDSEVLYGPVEAPDRHAGRAAIYTNPASWFVILRKIGIRTYTWFNWLYPFSG